VARRDGSGGVVLDGVEVRTPLRGAHNLRNLMLTLAAARALGVTVADAARGLAAMPVPDMRTAWVALGRATLINDAYNANPPSTRAASTCSPARAATAAPRASASPCSARCASSAPTPTGCTTRSRAARSTRRST
jgi:UDP-N-acetylmuramoyl-tripeptide--D-alanyl-D-alanine ligase